MSNMKPWVRTLLRVLSYVLVAAVTAGATYFLTAWGYWTNSNKLDQLQTLIDRCFIGQPDQKAIEDAAAQAMVDALGDQWSYYIPASQYTSYVEQMENAYVGIGVTIQQTENGDGLVVKQLEASGGAKEAGIQVGDVIVAVEDKAIADIGIDGATELIRGDEGTKVKLTIRRGEEESQQQMEFSVERVTIQVIVAQGEMLDNGIGFITIANFTDRCAEETIAQVDSLVKQGAKALIFDVRFNPGGYVTELVEVLDYLLPEGELFHSEYYTGEKETEYSDKSCVKLPMAVLVNSYSYSAAEFFAAALNEYDWAVIVGQQTVGKSYFQNTFQLADGSAVSLSIGKYTTPKGVVLAEVGGLTPEIPVEMDEEAQALLYSDALEKEEDLQLQAAIQALMEQLNG